MEASITRRRAFAIIAGLGASAAGIRSLDARTLEWRGTALGADATFIFAGADPMRANAALSDCIAEIERLERIFSLHLGGSEISRLNADGFLERPSLDMLTLLAECRRLHRLTEGLFDPTVQVIWDYWNGRNDAEPVRDDVPPHLLARVGFDAVVISPERITLAPDSAITLNGIAQGYITDRSANLLRAHGWRGVLIDLGEARALDGRTFDVVVRGGGWTIPLSNAALATSSSSPLASGTDRHQPHLFDPRTGAAVPRLWETVSVMHASATIADGLSTALLLAATGDASLARRVLARVPGARVWIRRRDGDNLVNDLDAKVTHDAFDPGVTEHELDGAQVAGASVDQHRPRPPQ